MHPEMERELARQRIEDLRREGAARSGDRASRSVVIDHEVVLRGARVSDRSAVAALAALDGVLPPLGPALVAVVEGVIRAVVPLDGGRPFSDPFSATRDLVVLLEARARQLEAARLAPARPRRLLAWLSAAAVRRAV